MKEVAQVSDQRPVAFRSHPYQLGSRCEQIFPCDLEIEAFAGLGSISISADMGVTHHIAREQVFVISRWRFAGSVYPFVISHRVEDR